MARSSLIHETASINRGLHGGRCLREIDPRNHSTPPLAVEHRSWGDAGKARVCMHLIGRPCDACSISYSRKSHSTGRMAFAKYQSPRCRAASTTLSYCSSLHCKQCRVLLRSRAAAPEFTVAHFTTAEACIATNACIAIPPDTTRSSGCHHVRVCYIVKH